MKTPASIISKPTKVVQPQFKVNFNVNPFNDSIINKGYNVIHEKAVRCPCLNRQNGDADPSCQNCGGSTWIYVEYKKTKALVQGIGKSHKQDQWTESDPGTARITMMGEDAPTYNDTITVIDLETNFSQIVYPSQVGAAITAFTIYPIVELQMAYIYAGPASKLRWLTIWQDGMNPDVWDIKAVDNTVILNPLTMPNIEEEYNVSLRYKHHPVYYINELEREVFVTEVQGVCVEPGITQKRLMPVRCRAVRAHYLPNANNLSGPRLYDNTNYDKFKPSEYQS